MKSQRRVVSTWQLISFLISSMIGVGILSMPRTVSETLNEMGWMGPIVGGLIALLPLLGMVYLSKEYPGLTFIEYSPLVLCGEKHVKWGKILCIPWFFLFFSFQFLNAGMVAVGFEKSL